MQYLLLLHMDESGWDQLAPDQRVEGQAAYANYTASLRDAGTLVASARLTNSDAAKTIRTKGGKPVITDGPFAETKEQIAGFYLIEAADLDDAVARAADCPGAQYGIVEVRQLFAPPA